MIPLEDWGLIEYPEATARQLARVDAVASGDAPECLVFCTHPPVVTVGRATAPQDLDGWSGPLLETSRGGRATYHGPSQLVIYPILDLRLRDRDVHAHLRWLEEATVRALRELGLSGAETRATPAGEISLTGVWVGEKKIASVGIAVRRWIAYHGVAVNVEADPRAHVGIRPCGFAPGVMTSLSAELGRALTLADVKPVFASVFRAHSAVSSHSVSKSIA